MEKITTQQAFQIVKLIGRLHLTKQLVAMIKTISECDRKKELAYRKLHKVRTGKGKISDKEILDLLNDNPVISEELIEIQGRRQEVTTEFAFDFIFAVAEEEEFFYETMSKVYGKSIDEVIEQDVADTVNDIIDIFNSKSFMGFLKSVK